MRVETAWTSEVSLMKSRPCMGVNSIAHFQILNNLVSGADIVKKKTILIHQKYILLIRYYII